LFYTEVYLTFEAIFSQSFNALRLFVKIKNEKN
jgi:hypothetical protein